MTKSTEKQKSYKTVKIDSKTHADLTIYKVRNGLKTLGDAVLKLLNEAQAKD